MKKSRGGAWPPLSPLPTLMSLVSTHYCLRRVHTAYKIVRVRAYFCLFQTKSVRLTYFLNREEAASWLKQTTVTLVRSRVCSVDRALGVHERMFKMDLRSICFSTVLGPFFFSMKNYALFRAHFYMYLSALTRLSHSAVKFFKTFFVKRYSFILKYRSRRLYAKFLSICNSQPSADMKLYKCEQKSACFTMKNQKQTKANGKRMCKSAYSNDVNFRILFCIKCILN